MITRIAVVCLLLFAGTTSLIADDKADGWVLAVHGKWTDGVKTLKLGDPVKVNDKVRGTGAPGDRLTVALLDGKPHEYTCEGKPGCTTVIEPFRPEPSALPARIFQALSTLATHREVMPISAISRGAEGLRQAVLPLNGDRLDLSPAVKQADPGAYTISLRRLSNGRPSTPKARAKGSVHWDPPAVTTASVPGLLPGLYELTMISAEGVSIGSEPVLVTGSSDYASKRQAFEEGEQLLATWPQGIDPAAIDAFQSAILFNISRVPRP